jgi:hypothetical protein
VTSYLSPLKEDAPAVSHVEHWDAVMSHSPCGMVLPRSNARGKVNRVRSLKGLWVMRARARHYTTFHSEKCSVVGSVLRGVRVAKGKVTKVRSASQRNPRVIQQCTVTPSNSKLPWSFSW